MALKLEVDVNALQLLPETNGSSDIQLGCGNTVGQCGNTCGKTCGRTA
jgi:hypothetical protein